MNTSHLIELDIVTSDCLGLLFDSSDEEEDGNRWTRGLTGRIGELADIKEKEDEDDEGIEYTSRDEQSYSQLQIQSYPEQETIIFNTTGDNSENFEGPSRGRDADTIRELIRGPSGNLRKERCANSRFIAEALGLGGPVGLPPIFRDILPTPRELFNKVFDYSRFEEIALRLHKNTNVLANSRTLMFALFLTEGNNWLEHFLYCGMYVFERNPMIRRGGKEYCNIFTISRVVFDIYCDLMMVMKLTLSVDWEYNYLLYKYAFAIDYIYRGLKRLPFNAFERGTNRSVKILSDSKYEPWVLEAIRDIKEIELLARDVITVINRDLSSSWIPRFFRRRIDFKEGARYRLIRLKLSGLMQTSYDKAVDFTSLRSFAHNYGIVEYKL